LICLGIDLVSGLAACASAAGASAARTGATEVTAREATAAILGAL